MDSSVSNDMLEMEPEVAEIYPPFLKIYKDGRVHRFIGTKTLPPSHDPKTNVKSKDVILSPDSSVSARIFLPKITLQNQKLPLLVYFHGGAFCIESPFSPIYHNHLNLVASKANVVVVSVNYRKAPEFPVPTGHEDSWAALKWVVSHLGGKGPDEWLNCYADLENVLFAGDSAGANIAHHMAIRVGTEGLQGLKLQGIVMVHPCFWGGPAGSDKVESPGKGLTPPGRTWRMVCPASSGSDDPIINPEKDPKLKSLGCERVLVFVAGKDMFFREWGFYYKALLEKSGWDGKVELIEHEEEGHVFHLLHQTCENANHLLNKIVTFINHGRKPSTRV